MKHIKYIIIFTICFIFFAPATSVYAEKIEGWERAFFLQPDDMDRIRLSNLYVEIEQEVLAKYNAVADYSKAYVLYTLGDSNFIDCYNTETNSIETVSYTHLRASGSAGGGRYEAALSAGGRR